MDLYAESVVERRGETFTFKEMPLTAWLDFLKSVEDLEGFEDSIEANRRLLELTVVEDHDWESYPFSLVKELGQLATKFHTGGKVEDQLKNSSGGRSKSPSIDCAAN